MNRRSLEYRFAAAVAPPDESGCWNWTARLTSDGYGIVSVKGRARRAHRVAYEMFVGPIPEGLTIDHLCRNRACVNPAHMEPVTHVENTLRGESPAARAARSTTCPKGHPKSGDNLAIDFRGSRVCLTCKRADSRAYRARKFQDPEWREREQARNREYMRRKRAEERTTDRDERQRAA